MSTNSCSCKGGGTASGAVLERPRYYPRQVVTSEVLNLGQDYQRNMQRIHNRMLHGWGVACGLVVCPVPAADNASMEPWKLMVRPGYALSPGGDGILVEKPRVIDLRESPHCVDPCEPAQEDPWCGDTYVEREPGIYHVAIKYAEVSARPERVQPSGCGCGNRGCEDSRVRDCYEIGVLCECQLADQEPPKLDTLFDCEMLHCPPCPTSPWVGLAEVEVSPDGTILAIDNCRCRRLVVSFANFWGKCDCQPAKIERPEREEVLVAAGEAKELRYKATGVHEKATVRATRDVKAELVSVGPGHIVVKVTPGEKAMPGPRTLIVVNPDGSMGTLSRAFEIGRAGDVAAPAPGRPPLRKRPNQ